MKFEYGKSEEQRECVAYIDMFGQLIVKNIRSGNSEEKSFVFMPNQGGATTVWDKFITSDAVQKFYPGDKITITF